MTNPPFLFFIPSSCYFIRYSPLPFACLLFPFQSYVFLIRPSFSSWIFTFRSFIGPGNILTVADDLLKNDGQKFLEMMEQLAERRMQREESAVRDLGSDDDDDDDEDGEDDDEDAEGDESDGEDEGEGSGEEGDEEGDGEYFAFVISPRTRACSCLSLCPFHSAPLILSTILTESRKDQSGIAVLVVFFTLFSLTISLRTFLSHAYSYRRRRCLPSTTQTKNTRTTTAATAAAATSERS